MEFKYPMMGAFVTACIFTYLFCAFPGKRTVIKWRVFISNMRRPLTWKGFLWATALPGCWLLLFYTFVAHVRILLGRWPEFGEQLEGWSLAFHEEAIQHAVWVLFCSLYVAPVITVACLFFPRWRHMSFYAATYGAAGGMAFGAIFLAPDSFLNWYLD
jgi:hypothetical protein